MQGLHQALGQVQLISQDLTVTYSPALVDLSFLPQLSMLIRGTLTVVHNVQLLSMYLPRKRNCL